MFKRLSRTPQAGTNFFEHSRSEASPLETVVICEVSHESFYMNWNGKCERMVAAKTKKAAIEKLKTTAYQFNQFASETGNVQDIAVAMSDPGSVFERSYRQGSEWINLDR